jgi:hypothetical protein
MKEMEDNYLWDRSGEVDPEIQELEEILGALRYQPRPLEIPAQFPIARGRDYRSWLAIAAAVAMVTIGLALWFSFNRRETVAPLATKHDVPVEGKGPASAAPDQAIAPAPSKATVVPQGNRRPVHNLMVRNNARPLPNITREPQLTPQELADKEQVLVALRLVSFKLNVAQRKAQGAPLLSPIRNQHRIG